MLNDTRVIPARLYGQKTTGSKVEILLIAERSPNCWLALVKPGKTFCDRLYYHFLIRLTIEIRFRLR